MKLRKNLRRYLAKPQFQRAFRMLYRISLAGMNYGGAGSVTSSGDELALGRLSEINPGARQLVVFDVGANVGGYVAQVLRVVGDEAFVYAFEPSKNAFGRLREAYDGHPRIRLIEAGVGAIAGTTMLWSSVPGSVLASTYLTETNVGAAGERIELVTLDAFCEQNGIEKIHLLKLDLEGGELDALRGASRLLEANAIDMIQFEFGQPSLGARTFFADLFGLLTKNYEIYRVLPNGLERLDSYHETLEVFMSTNYLAVSRSNVVHFRS